MFVFWLFPREADTKLRTQSFSPDSHLATSLPGLPVREWAAAPMLARPQIPSGSNQDQIMENYWRVMETWMEDRWKFDVTRMESGWRTDGKRTEHGASRPIFCSWPQQQSKQQAAGWPATTKKNRTRCMSPKCGSIARVQMKHMVFDRMAFMRSAAMERFNKSYRKSREKDCILRAEAT